MNKLIATEFAYVVRDEFGTEKKQRGSYLGRKAATLRTLRRFSKSIIKKYTPASSLVALTPCASYVTPWIAK